MEYAVDLNAAPPLVEDDAQIQQRNADHEESKRERDVKEEDEEDEEDDDEEGLEFVLNTEDVEKGTSAGGSFLRKPTFLRTTNNKGSAPFGFNKQATSTQPNQQNQIQGQSPQITGSTVVIAGTVHPVNYHLYNGLVGGYIANQKSALELEEIEDKQWRKPGADITDYFNYGFNEDTWKAYTAKQVQLRLEQSMQSKIKVWTSAHEQPQANSDMPHELLGLSGTSPSPRMRMQTQAIPVVGGNSPPMSQTPTWERQTASQPEHRRRQRESDDSVIQVLASAEEGKSGGPEGEFPGFPPGMRPPFPGMRKVNGSKSKGGIPPGMPMPMPPGYDRGYPPRGREDRERRFPGNDRPPSERDFFDEHQRDERFRRDEERRREDYDRRSERRDDRDRRERDREKESSSSRDRESSSRRDRDSREDDHKRHKSRDDEERKRRRDH